MGGISAQERNWAALSHAAGGVAMFFVPSFGFVAPLLVWLLKKDESEVVAYHARQALAFQVGVTLAVWACGVAGTALSCFVIGLLFYPIGAVLWLAGVVVPLLAANQVNNGRDDYAYPLTGQLVERPLQLR